MNRYLYSFLIYFIILSFSNTYADEWTNMNPPFNSGDVNLIKFKNEQIGFVLIGCVPWIIGCELWRTTDSGESFSMIDSTVKVFNIYFFGDTILAPGVNGVLRSTDNFNTYEILEYSFGADYTPKSSFLLNPSWWIISNTGNEYFYKTTDAGLTWSQITSPSTDIHKPEIYFSDPLNGIVVKYNSWKTTDGGITWNNLFTQTTNLYFHNNIIIIKRSPNPNWFISTNFGSTWTGRSDYHAKFAINDSFIIAYDVSRYLNISYDYGTTWQEYLGAVWDCKSLDAVNDSVFYMGSSLGSIYKTADKGNSWSCVTSPIFNIKCISVPKPGVIYAAGENLLRSYNDGRTWDVVYGPGYFTKIYFKDELTGFAQLQKYAAADKYYFVKTTDGGTTWDTLYTWPFNIFNSINKIYFKNTNDGFVIGPELYFRTRDGGNTWDFDTAPGGIDINFLNSEMGYIGSSPGYLTLDGGNTWQESENFTGGTIFFVDTLTGFRGYNYGLQKTTDGGNTYFDLINHGQDDSWSDLLFWGRDTGIVYWHVHEQILMTTDCGETWNHIFQLRNGMTFDLDFISPDYGWVAENTGLIYKYSTSVTTDVTETKITKPDNFYLEQNFPNPFNPSTSIKFSIPQRGFVSLQVYDVLGNLVAELINEEKLPGSYQSELNGTSLSSGVYFYILRTGSFIQTKKMILLR